MFKFIANLRSKYQRREMQKGFDSVFEEKPSFGEKILLFIINDWRFLITTIIAAIAAAASVATFFFKP